jgi:hypothetical protein
MGAASKSASYLSRHSPDGARHIAPMLEETTTDPVVADVRNFFKGELWTSDDRVERMLYAGSNLHRARKIFGDQIRRRPASIVTLRQRTRVLRKWP